MPNDYTSTTDSNAEIAAAAQNVPGADTSDALTSTISRSIPVLSDQPNSTQIATDLAMADESATDAYLLAIAAAAQALDQSLMDTYTNLYNLTGSSTASGFKLALVGGVPILSDSNGIKSVSIAKDAYYNSIDESEAVDFANRYISLDAAFHDGSDAPNNISFMRIISNDGLNTQIFPSTGNWLQPGITETKFKQFILSSVGEASQERMQIVETSQEFQILFYGKKPEILNISGILKNTRMNPWSANMVFLWNEFMRGTKLVESGNILQIYIDGDIYNGYPFGFTRSKISGQDFLVSFSFSFIIKDRIQTNKDFGGFGA